MFKFACFAILCFAVGSSLAHNHGGGSFFSNWHIPFLHDRASICGNTTIAPIYAAQAASTMNTWQANPLYNATLQLRFPNLFAYIKNPANQAMASTNCTLFLNGILGAKAADRTAEKNREQQMNIMQQQLEQIAKTVTSTSGSVDVNDGGF